MVMGAFCPSLICATEPDGIEKKRGWDSKPTTSHIFFQFQPKFHLLRLTETHILLPIDFICFDDEITGGTIMQSLKAIATDNNILPKHYWIGAPEGTEAGLRIDPGAMMPALRTVATPIKSPLSLGMKT